MLSFKSIHLCDCAELSAMSECVFLSFLVVAGKSLDVCAELREKKKLKEPFKKKKKSLAEQTKTIHKKEVNT